MWKIKDDEIRERVCKRISENELSDLVERCKRFRDAFDSILIDDGKNSFYEIPKSLFIWEEYDPIGWNHFPIVKPRFEGLYLVTTINPLGRKRVIPSYYSHSIGWNAVANRDVLAFMELPLPYEEERT